MKELLTIAMIIFNLIFLALTSKTLISVFREMKHFLISLCSHSEMNEWKIKIIPDLKCLEYTSLGYFVRMTSNCILKNDSLLSFSWFSPEVTMSVPNKNTLNRRLFDSYYNYNFYSYYECLFHRKVLHTAKIHKRFINKSSMEKEVWPASFSFLSLKYIPFF